METEKCPKCSTPMLKVWNNKRRQRVGKCLPCGKLVYLGKSTDSPEEGGKEEKGKTPEAAPTPKRATAKPAASTHRRATGSTGKRSGASKPVGKNQQPIQQPATGTSDPISDFVRRVWKW